jgi:Na+/H+ antiporter NhaD/arsenite permease-like protein
MILPFAALLAAIALAPLWFGGWWGRHYGKVSLGLAAMTLCYYLGGLHATHRVLETSLEYLSFICLVGSLFVISGGIHIGIKGEATPGRNVLFLLFGALVANVLGTTGASMLLIRPWLRANKYRLTAHHVVFFIFIVSNTGGALTPVGDPPLFLGYLKGVPFFWVIRNCWPMWVVATGLLLAVFYVIDRRNFLRAPAQVREAETAVERWRIRGGKNVLFLGVVLASVFIEHPKFLREALMLSAALGSYLTTPKEVHAANDFSFHPIIEVALLFAGIFATMMPALDWLQANAARFGQPQPALLYWGAGTLSSVLDNAPTYLSFLSATLGAFAPAELCAAVSDYVKVHGTDPAALAGLANAEAIQQAIAALQNWFPAELARGEVNASQVGISIILNDPFYNRCLQAISMGSVFFGANTYIGNGPNFMVKAIAEQQKANAPDFVSYILKFALPILVPIWLVIWFLFFR